ncbi:Williams-Beuren syndrome chromosomal region 27 protein [Liparis tanakae]|uniref:Williams-Beuren syndrome chromosomal region 27 protein n=1 Tax=Liparis tanakae TaxID=230148 RepID=A0A4Z2EIT4_9TELE|nr:Williams-Beuren syndrome chromosomal region 27 protein [Liparis tanakae]
MSSDGRTVNDVMSFVKTCQGADSQRRMKFYDGWAETYEQDHSILNYRAPDHAVDFLMENFSGPPEEVQVLDVACGSGLVAKLVSPIGEK